MLTEEFDLHMQAGRYFGVAATCGKKVDYKTEQTAIKSAARQSVQYEKELEAYPCFFCNGWHIGRKLTEAEREFFEVFTGG